MQTQSSLASARSTSRFVRGAASALALLLAPGVAAAAQAESAWSLNFTPVLVLPEDDYRLGGGTDPEVKHTQDLGGAFLSVGGRVGGYYAKNLFGVTVMPTLRLMLPLGPVEPYVSAGAGYGWLPKIDHQALATMSRVGVVFRFSEDFALGVEGTLQQVHGSDFAFPSFGSMLSIDL